MAALEPPLMAWIEAVTGTSLVDVQELTGGASRNSYILTGRDGSKAFLRLDAGRGPLSGTAFTLQREYSVLAQLQGSGLPIAKVYDFSQEHDALLMEFLPGHTSYEKTGTPQEEAALRRELVAAIVMLQRVDPRRVSALGPRAGAALGEVIPEDMRAWQQLYDERASLHDPLIDFTLNWLSQSVPDAGSASVIVHGDLGPGNFMINEGRISALIDWEMVRLGHPLEDLACVIARALGAPFGEAREHIANFEALSGEPVDAKKLDYALALVLARWLIAMQTALSKPSALQNVPMLFAFRQINGLSLIEALFRAQGLRAPVWVPRLRGADPCRIIFHYSQACLAEVARDAQAPAAAYKLRGIIDLQAYLRDFIDYGPERYEREETEQIEAVLGRKVNSAAEANRLACEFARTVKMSDARPLLEFLRWRSEREQLIMRTSLGVRKDNRIHLDSY
jgi:aminoglycoside phosphotransferase (APT) family kinase protein